MTIKLVGAAYGDSTTPATGSGAPYYLFAALERRYGALPRIDYSLPSWQRSLVAATAFRPSRQAWAQRFHVNPISHRLRSRILRRKLKQLQEPFDLLFQVHGWTEPSGGPYVAYVDTTWALASAHWPNWVPPVGRERRWWHQVECRMYQNALHLFTMGRPAADSLIDSYGVAAERVTVVGGGLNFDVLPSTTERSFSPLILFVGRDWERKGGPTLVTAFQSVKQQIPDARLKIVGTAPQIKGPGIEILGNIPDRAVISDLYAHAAIFCMPSSYEPYGFAFLEAMAHGVPCVGTRIGAIPEIIEEGRTGLLVPPRDAGSLAAALVRILRNPQLAETLGAAGRRRVKREFTWDRVVDRMNLELMKAARSQ